MNPGTVLLLGLVVLLYLNFLGRRRAQRERTALQQRLLPGAEVVMTSGLHGTVVEVPEDGTLLLEDAPGHVTRWEKLAVGRIVSSPADPAAEADPEADPEDEPVEEAPPALGGTAADGTPAHPPVEPVREGLPDTAPNDRA